MKVAVISDIHGNSFALKEVLKDIRNKSADVIINLGDSLYGPLDPLGTYELLISNDIMSLSGNEDRIIIEDPDKGSASRTLEFVRSAINDQVKNWLRNLPFNIVFNQEIFCCHGTPLSDSEYLLEYIEKGCVSIKDAWLIDKLLVNIKQNIVVCGHSHISNIVGTNSKLIVNPGSVGLPAYDDDYPVYHRMQNYNPRASYAILNINAQSISVERYSIDYDNEKARRLALLNNHHDWAEWIKTGTATHKSQ